LGMARGRRSKEGCDSEVPFLLHCRIIH
jgi:hypothetical protein